jgi:ribonuclease Z
MSFTLQILGSGSSIPTMERNSTSQLLINNENHFLIDCGEATQHQLFKFGAKLNKIEKIFISHLHGDHFFGLPGLLSTLRLLGREKPLEIYGPTELEGSINCVFKLSKIKTVFEIRFINLKNRNKELIFEDKNISIHSFPLKHRLDTFGFLFKEKQKPRNIKKDFIAENKIPFEKIREIKAGKNFIDNHGILHKNEDISYKAHFPKSYAYCSDTAYYPDLKQYFENVDLLYHEASFLEEDKVLATEKEHSTAAQAAEIAKLTKSKNLLLGHFSNRYKTADDFKKQASQIFKNVMLAYDGQIIDFDSIS